MHFALAFAVSVALTEAAGILGGRDRLERFGSTLVLLGTAAVVLAVATGYLAANTAPGLVEGVESAALDRHERFALLGAGSLLLAVVWKGLGGGRIAPGQRRVYALALIVVAALLLWAALLGGTLVYELGVGVTAPG
ncbi:MAG TPA: DUF2231 domain-containing protein [Candidatus Polarisedimenticolaceae bacterium]|nr:DUF2231 domain-containing protein [Candidatus Polarisedimenticolaceae bacterium]